MTRFIDVPAMQKLVRHITVPIFIQELVGFLENDFRRWADFKKVSRIANHSEGGVIELMPTSTDQLYTFKYVNGHPRNAIDNKLTVMAFGALAEVDTGFPILLSEMTLATALRTAATSVLAAKYLLVKPAQTMAVIGNGAQSEFQIMAFYTVLNVRHFRIYDIDRAASEKLKQNLSEWSEISIEIMDTTADAVKNVDIITTVTADKKNATIITPEMLTGPVYINAVGGDCPGKTELHASVTRAADVFVEYEPQSRIEGEIQFMDEAFKVTELWEIMTGAKSLNLKRPVTLFDSVGFAIEDFSVLRYVYERAQELDVGEVRSVVPEPDNIRDLWSFVSTGPTAVGACSAGIKTIVE